MKYELDWTRCYPENGHHTMIAILTGRDLDEIIAVSSPKDGWYGRDYRNAFRNLGFNVNERFIKFDPDTDKPCIMRFVLRGKNREYGWHARVYYDGLVYEQSWRWEFKDWLRVYRRYRVTSMLQVWI